MDEVIYITEKELEDILEEEKKNLKEGRIYLILEASEENEDLFSMICLDRTKNNEDGTSSVCQTIAKGLVHLLASNSEEIFNLGQTVLDHEPHKENNVVPFDASSAKDNVVSLDTYRKEKHNPSEKGYVTVTFSFNDDENDDESA